MNRIQVGLLLTILLCVTVAAAEERTLSTDANAEQMAFFEKKIRPVLVKHCYECHSADSKTPQGGLLLDTRAGIRRGGDSGASVVPGSVDESLVMDAITYDELFYQMPPSGKLPAHVIADFQKWIEMGAPDPRDGGEVARSGIDWNEARKHWAYQPMEATPPPEVAEESWAKSEIDRFILARLESQNLKPAAPANKRTLIRRLTFDLIGLPPTPEEIQNFLSDDDSEAYEKVVDRLLASPHYGERWARHWMDLVRFAETNGHNRDIEKPNAYRYRDYLIDTFNQDVPYDRFIMENLAGDQLEPRPTSDGTFNASVMGTGMLWFSELHHNPVDPLLQRADQVDAQLDTIGKMFLGLTLGCARCHDHKFDPIPITDYYALAGIFHSTQSVIAGISVDAKPSRNSGSRQQAQALEKELDQWLFNAVDTPRLREVRRTADYLRASVKLIDVEKSEFDKRVAQIAEENNLNVDVLKQWMVFLEKRDTPNNANLGPWLKLIRQPESRMQETIQQILASTPPPGAKPVNPFTVEALTSPAPESFSELADRYQAIMEMIITTKQYDSPRHKQWLNWFHRSDTPFTAAAFAEDLEEEQLEELAAKRRKLAHTKQGSELPKALASADANDNQWPEWTPIQSPFQERRESSKAKLGDVKLHIRGSHQNLGDPVPRGFLRILTGEKPLEVEDGSGRVELARAIADPLNPLTARVLVNRLWAHHFGEGLVRTVDNFGTQGEPPTHPKLLDSLALRFIENGWSLKAMHRMMILSKAYQMSSESTAAAMKADPDNRLWHHIPVRRLDAESIRDSILAVAGTLDPTQFGEGVNPNLTPYMYPRYRPPSGPVDGNHRRSIYLTVRRNFVPALLANFDLPPPNDTIGKRDLTFVPSQALSLLNNEFVHQQSAKWGQAVAASDESDDQRIHLMFERATGNPPDDTELKRIRQFVDQQQATGASAAETWSAVAHVLFNLKSFIFVR